MKLSNYFRFTWALRSEWLGIAPRRPGSVGSTAAQAPPRSHLGREICLLINYSFVDCCLLYGKRDSIRHHLLEVTFETATVPELRQKLLYTTPSGWWWWWWWRWWWWYRIGLPNITRWPVEPGPREVSAPDGATKRGAARNEGAGATRPLARILRGGILCSEVGARRVHIGTHTVKSPGSRTFSLSGETSPLQNKKLPRIPRFLPRRLGAQQN